MGKGEETAKGAVGGAMTGAAIGSIVPGVGTGIGAGVGALAGGALGYFGGGGDAPAPKYNSHYSLPGFDTQYGQFGRQASRFGNRNTSAYNLDKSAYRNDQTTLIRMLQAQARGEGPGQEIVRKQAQDASDHAMQQQQGMALAAGPGSGAMAARSAAMAGAQAQSAVGGQAAMGGLQAQQQALGALGQNISDARGQDFNWAKANQDGQLQMTQMNDQAQLEALRQRLAAAEMQQRGGLAYNNIKAGHAAALAAQPTLGDQLMGMGGGFGQGYMMSKMGGGGKPSGGKTT